MLSYVSTELSCQIPYVTAIQTYQLLDAVVTWKYPDILTAITQQIPDVSTSVTC